MTYKVRVKADGWDLEDGQGNVISADNPLPVTAPDDIVGLILDDVGVGEPQKQAFRVLLTRDWEVVDGT